MPPTQRSAMCRRLAAILASAVSLIASARADDPDAERAFESEVRPILAANCVECHGPDQQKGGLRLDTRAGLVAGGDSGRVVEPGSPEASLLVEAIRHDGLRMPPRKRLRDEEIAAIERWVARGAAWPAEPADHADAGAPALRARGELTDEDRSWWAFRPLRRPPIPEVDDSAWPRTPLDRFILARLEAEGLHPAGEADRGTLIRRVSFDLTGLPPSPEEVDAFLADARPDAYERLVDRLLASPAYGERWARHWLDLARYAESDGYRQDAFRPTAYRYRDWVIAAFNEDLPFGRFVQAQLAGDEIAPDSVEMRVATTFLRLGPYEFNQRDVAGQRGTVLNELTDTVGDVFLGLGLGCARCHDHKFDPILQADYFRLQGFLAATLPRDDLPLASAEEAAAHRAAMSRWEAATADLRAQIDDLERPYREQARAEALAKFQPEFRAAWETPEAERTPYQRQIAYLIGRQLVEEFGRIDGRIKGREKVLLDALQKKLAAHDAIRPAPLPMALTVTDVGPTAPPNVIPGDRQARDIAPGYPAVVDPAPAAIETVDGLSTGRRLTLARWLTRPDHPLTPRVLANRLWQHHFGRGLAPTTSDFGHLGMPPSHPELLDWLAVELVERGWSLKAMHRLIVTSAAYRQGAAQDTPTLDAAVHLDPENRLLWCRTPRRLEAEVIRDAMLNASGELDRRAGGPSASSEEPRRSVYLKVIRNSPDPLLATFDAPDGNATTPERNRTTTATQALAMVNGAWTLARAEAMARRLDALGVVDRDERIDRLFRWTLGRAPSDDERRIASRFLDQNDAGGWSDLAHALFNSNAFLYVD